MAVEIDRQKLRRERHGAIQNCLSGAKAMERSLKQTSTVRTISDFSELILRIASTGPAGFLYRGESRLYDTQLSPTFGRHPPFNYTRAVVDSTIYNITTEEIAAIRDFATNAPDHIDQRKPDEQDSSWVSLAQHYGTPTRLLDVSANPLVGLFFSCISLGGDAHMWNADEDGVVYALPCVDMIRQTGDPIEATNEEIPHTLVELFGVHAGDEPNGAVVKWLDPLVRDVRFNRRLRAQNGSFVWWNPVAVPYPKELEGLIFCIRGDAKPSLLRELSGVGIRPDIVFPDEAGRQWQTQLDEQLLAGGY